MFFGLGADGTVGANKASVKIIGEHTDLFAQGYFVYDSKKSGSVTVSHLRFGPEPIRSTYLIEDADFVACHQFGLLEKMPVLDRAKPGATFLLNSPYRRRRGVGPAARARCRPQIIDKDLARVGDRRLPRRHARSSSGARINTVMQPCFFALAGVLPADEAIDAHQGVGRAGLRQARRRRSSSATSRRSTPRSPRSPASTCPPTATSRRAPRSVAARRRARLRHAGHGPADGRRGRPAAGVGAARRRHVPDRHGAVREAGDRPGDPDLGPRHLHRLRQVRHRLPARHDPDEGVRAVGALDGAPPSFQSKEFRSKDIAGYRMTIQVAPDDCTGCGVCVDVCPAKSKTEVAPQGDQHGAGAGAPRRRAAGVGLLPVDPRARPRPAAARLGQGLAGAAAAVRVLRRLRRLRRDAVPQAASRSCSATGMVVANATGCSSIYGGNLPTTPWTTNADGPRPGVEQLAVRGQRRVRARAAPRPGGTRRARRAACSSELADAVGADLVAVDPAADQDSERRHPRPTRAGRQLRDALEPLADADGDAGAPPATCWRSPTALTRKGVWIIGGDGWAYDIGFGGLDHVLSSRTQRQHPRARHRGLLEHRRPGVEGDAARRRRQVRRGRQGDRQEGPRRHRPGLRQRVRRRDRHRRQRPADDQGAARGRRLARAVARHRLLDVHRPRHRHGQVDEPPEGRRASPATGRCTASSRARPSTASRSSSTRTAAVDAGRRLRRHRGPLRRCSPAPTPSGPSDLLQLAQADVDERWRYYSQLGTIERTVAHDSPDTDGDPPTPSPTRRPERMTDLDTTLPRARAALADRRLGRAAHRRPRHGCPPRRRRRRRRRAAVAVRGGDRPRAGRADAARWKPAPSSFAEATRLLPRPARRSRPAPTATSPTSSRTKARVPVPVIASLNASTPGGWPRYARLLDDAGADAIELNLYRVAADPTATAADGRSRRPRARRRRQGRRRRPGRASSSRPSTRRWPTSPRGPSQAGADGLVLFNRFYQPDLDLDTLDVVPRLELSTPWELRLPLRWIAILRPILAGRPASPRPAAWRPAPMSPRRCSSAPTWR